jgi:hypothetical protein
MEADWSVEIGANLPRIHVPWEGFVDLRQAQADLNTIAEAARFPPLARALATLNGKGSLVFTAKSDVWSITGGEIDPDEFASQPEDACCGQASYIDVIERDLAKMASFDFHERRARQVVEDLRMFSMRNGRIDLVIRGAIVDNREGYAITLYAAGCGADTASAATSWESVLAAAVLASTK